MDSGQQSTIASLVEELKLAVNQLEVSLDRILLRDAVKLESGKNDKGPPYGNAMQQVIVGLAESIKQLSTQNDRLTKDILLRII